MIITFSDDDFQKHFFPCLGWRVVGREAQMQQASLSASGLPVLYQDEVELLLIPRATIESLGTFRIYLTSIRIIGVSESPKGMLIFSLVFDC